MQQVDPELSGRDAGPDALRRRRLLRVERKRGSSHRLAVGEVVLVGVPLHPPGLLHDQALLHQGMTGGSGRVQPRQQERLLLRDQLLRDTSVEGGLSGGPPTQFGQFLRCQGPGGRQVDLPLHPHAAADRPRDHPFQNGLEGRGVIRLHPPGQLDQVGREHRLILHQLADQLEVLLRIVIVSPYSRHHCQHLVSPDRDPDQRADRHPRHVRGQAIGQLLVEPSQRKDTNDATIHAKEPLSGWEATNTNNGD